MKKRVQLSIFLSILSLVLPLCFAGCSCHGDAAIDPNLEPAIREQLGKPRGVLTGEDWARLETVKALGSSIKSINGLQAAVNLRELNLRRNEISDLSPLSGLTRLEVLILADNKIEDISGLNGTVLSGLQHLDLSINKISDLTVLDWDKMALLTRLDIRYNYINLQDQAVTDLLRSLTERGVEVLAEPMYLEG